MKFQLLVLCCCVLQTIYGLNISDQIIYPPGLPSGRVVGGQEAEDGKYPYQCSIQLYEYKHRCGCAIISDKWILTAAHCLAGQELNTLSILVGSNHLEQGGYFYEIDKFHMHKKYNKPMYANDIAVIRVKGKIQFNDRVQPIELATEEVPNGSEVTLTGWGSLSFRGPQPQRLQMIKLKALSTQSCQRTQIGQYVHTGHICTYTRVGEGACNGDSGGPLAYNNKIVGVVNFALQCAKGSPDAFAKVSYYNEWIKKHTAE